MEQSTGHVSEWYTEEERQVAEFLIELSHSEPPFPYWVRKRRRSAIQDNLPSFSSLQTPLHHQPSCHPETQTPLASSPATPLSFSPTESDENPNNLFPRKTSLKKKKECYLKIIEDLTKTKASLNEEMDNVKRYRDQLTAINWKLKAKKKELINGPKTDSKISNLEFGRSMQWVYVNGSVNPSNSNAENEQQKQPQLQLQMEIQMQKASIPNSDEVCVSISEIQNQLGCSSSSVLGNKGPLAIPDLNSTPDSDEFTQLVCCEALDESMANKDLSRVIAAQARQRRIQIFRFKNPSRNDKQLCGYR